MTRTSQLLRSETAATSIEYAAIAALISIVAIGTIATIGTTVSGFFASIPAF